MGIVSLYPRTTREPMEGAKKGFWGCIGQNPCNPSPCRGALVLWIRGLEGC